MHAISLDSIPQISLGTAALLIFGAIASLAMLRGLFRILWSTAVLCLASIAAFLAWQHSGNLAKTWFEQEPTWFPTAFPLAAFIAVFLFLRTLARFFVKPLGDDEDDVAERNRKSPIRWMMTLLFSLVPTGLLWFVGATFLRHAGSVAELRSHAETLADQPVSQLTTFLTNIKKDIESAIPTEWFQKVDPQSSDLRLTLAKLISSPEEIPPKAIPVLEEPEMRSLILGDSGLRQLAREGRYAEILRDPRLDQLLENDDLCQVLEGLEL